MPTFQTDFIRGVGGSDSEVISKSKLISKGDSDWQVFFRQDAFILRVKGAEPVAIDADNIGLALQLLSDNSLVLVDKGASLLLKLWPAKGAAAGTSSGQALFHHLLSGNARVVCPGKPESVLFKASLTANKNVLEGHGEGVAGMEDAGHVRRRDDDAEGVACGIELRPEGPGLLPCRIPTRFDAFRVVR